jgi:hypothetical protein
MALPWLVDHEFHQDLPASSISMMNSPLLKPKVSEMSSLNLLLEDGRREEEG